MVNHDDESNNDHTCTPNGAGNLVLDHEPCERFNTLDFQNAPERLEPKPAVDSTSDCLESQEVSRTDPRELERCPQSTKPRSRRPVRKIHVLIRFKDYS